MFAGSVLMLRHLFTTLPNLQLALNICLCISLGQVSSSQGKPQLQLYFCFSLTTPLFSGLPLNTYDSSDYNATHTIYNSLSPKYELSYNGSDYSTKSIAVSSTAKPVGILNGSLPMILVSQVTPIAIPTKPKIKPRDRKSVTF